MPNCPHCKLPLTESDLTRQLCPHCHQPVKSGQATIDLGPGQITLDQPTGSVFHDGKRTVSPSHTVVGDPQLSQTMDSTDLPAPYSDSSLANTIDSTDMPEDASDPQLSPAIDSADFPSGEVRDSSFALEQGSQSGRLGDTSPTIDSADFPAGELGDSSIAFDQGSNAGRVSDTSVTIDSSVAASGWTGSGSVADARSSQDDQPRSGDEIDRRLRQVWGSQVASSRPQMTMRGSSGSIDDFEENTTLIIRQRAVRRSTEDAPPTMADYDLLSVLGEGGMGVVYNARQASIDREVAVKMLKPEMTASSTHRRKFLSEVAVTGELDHPNIVPIYDLGQNADGALFYSMKKVTGTPWSQVIRKTPLLENLTILMKVSDAVAFAHARGVVHRDLKPENVMLGDYGEVLVLDWGLAIATKGHRPTPNVSTMFTIAGSPAYMAPELVFGPMEAIGCHSDVYLLGAILYECITGRPPHGGKSAKDCLKNAAKNVIVPTDKRGELLEIALKAMHTDPRLRHPTVQAFQEAIRDYQAHSESIILCERAEAGLKEASETNDYQDYARTLFAFEEAQELWPGNEHAKSGATRARLLYASCALAKSDFDLGLSLIDQRDPTHESVRRQLALAKAERDARQHRLARARKAMAALAALVFVAVSVGVVVASYLAYVAQKNERLAVASAETARREETRAKKSEEKAIESEKAAKDSETKAKDSERKAKDSEKKAKDSEQKAKDSEQSAKDSAGVAKREADNARKAEREAVASAYTALIAMAAARIDENAFEQARQALQACDEKLRGWEWRRLMHVVEQGDVTQLVLPARSEALAVNSRGSLIATGGIDGIVRVWDRNQRALSDEQRCGENSARITALAFHPQDDHWLVVGLSQGPKALVAWNRQSGEFRWPADDHAQDAGVVQATFSADGRSFLTAADNGEARLWSWETLVPRTFAGHTGTVWSAALSADGKMVATASEDGTVRVWNAATGEQLRSPSHELIPFTQHRGPVYAVVFLPDSPSASLAKIADGSAGQPVYRLASAGYDKRILLWQTDKLVPFDFQKLVANRPVAESDYQELTGHSAAVRALAVSSDGIHLASAASDHTLRVWQIQESSVSRRGTLIKELRGHAGPVYAASFAPGDANAIVSTGYDGQLRLWSIDQYDEQQMLPGLTLRGHVAPVLSARFSPRGDGIVTASIDRSARTWNSKTGAQRRLLREGHAYLASRALFFPKSRKLLTAGGDGTIRIWDLDKQSELRVLERTGYRAAAAVSPDERLILTGSSDLLADDDRPHGALVWNVDSGEKPQPLVGAHKAPVTCVAWSPAAERPLVMTADDNGVFQLWHPERGVPLGPRIDQHGSPIVAAEFTKDGQSLITADASGQVFRWNVSDPQAIEKVHAYPHPAGVQSIALMPDGGHLLTGGADGRLRLFDIKGDQPLWIADALSQKAGFLVSAEAPALETISAVSLAWDPVKKVAVAVAIDSLRYPASGTRGSDSDEEFVRLFELDFAAGAFREVSRAMPRDDAACLIDLRKHGAVGWSAAISPGGDQIVTVGRDEARLWGRDGNEVAGFRPHHELTFAAYSHAGYLIVTASLDNSVRVWDAASGQPGLTLDDHSAGPQGGHKKPVNCAVFSPDDAYVYTASDDGTVRKWELATMRVVQVIEVDPRGVTRIDVSADGQKLFAASRSGEASIWLLSNPKAPLHQLRGHEGAILDLCLSSNEEWLVTGGADNTARIWNAATGKELIKLAGHVSEVTAVAILADPVGLRVLTGSSDKTARLWAISGLGAAADAPEPGSAGPQAKELLSLKGHTRGLTSVAFAPDGQAALTSARDGLTILWPTTPAVGKQQVQGSLPVQLPQAAR